MARDASLKRPIYFYLLVLTICSVGGLHLWRTLFDNFSVHAIGLDGHHIGIIQSVREIPGFLSLLVVYLLLVVKEHRLSALAVLVLGLGIVLTGAFPSFYGIVFTTLVMSFGFHFFETTNQSLVLQYFDTSEAPLVFGRLKSVAAASCIVLSVVVYVVAPLLDFWQIYLVFGVAIIAASLFMLLRDPSEPNMVPQKKTMVLKKIYWLYYVLTFLAGARRQIFVAFAVFLLVKKFSFSLQEIALLFLLNNAVNFFLAPFIARCIKCFGERLVLSVEYTALIVIFIAYATTESSTVVAFLYVFDHIFFNCAIAIRTFFQKIADPSDIAPSMAVGFTINHIAAVVLPFIGGMLWLIDYRIPFVAGAVLSLVSLGFVQCISSQIEKHGS